MRVRSVVLGLCGVLLVAAPGPASAEVVRHRDPLGDVARSPVGANTYVAAPTQVQGDILSVKVGFANHAVWVGYRFRDLAMSGNGNFHLIGLESDRRSRTIRIDAYPGHWEGRASMTTLAGRPVACGLRFRIDYDLNLVVVRIPRPCIGKRAAWVRVGVRTTVAGTTYAYVDDARANGYSPNLHYGRRVHRATPR